MMGGVDPARSAEVLEPGMRVEVRRRFDERWARGFEVAEVTEGGYRVRRVSDGQVLPTDFSDDELRREKRRQGLWWA